jgi:hypothetical protein
MIIRLALVGLLVLGTAAGCGEVTADSGPPVAGTTPSTFNPLRREAATITQQSQGISVR